MPAALAWPAAMIVWGPRYTSTLQSSSLRAPPDGVARHAAHPWRRATALAALRCRPGTARCGARSGCARCHRAHRLHRARKSAGRRAIGPGPTLSKPRVEAWVREKLLCERRLPKIHPRVNRVSLADAFESLLPLSNSKMRRLFVATRSDWVACFQNGIQGSVPFRAVSYLAQHRGVLAKRVCCTPKDATYSAEKWEVY